MAEFIAPQNRDEYNRNFVQIKPLMNDTQAYMESSRCLYCYDAPCVQACPTSIDIPLFIRQIHAKNTLGAAKTIYESNYFGYACGKVCPTEVLCEGSCVYNEQDVKPIEIGRLQSYATARAIGSRKQLFEPARSNGKRVAVIGAGPAGISCACELRMLGFAVDIYEAKSLPSGLTLHGVAPYKISNEDVLEEMAYLEEQFGFTVRYNSAIVSREDIEELEKQYDAIFLGIGLGGTSKLNIPGEDFENVMGAVEFVEALRLQQHLINVPARVIVLGGGNTAMDAASESARMGAGEVILAYRRSWEEMGAYDFEFELAKSVGVKGLFNVSPQEILGEGRVRGVKFIRTQTADGKVIEIPGSEFIVEADWVIKATGQSKQEGFLSQIKDLVLDRKGCIVVDPVTMQCSNPKYFAAGDAVSGGQEVVNAAADGKKAARAIAALAMVETV